MVFPASAKSGRFSPRGMRPPNGLDADAQELNDVASGGSGSRGGGRGGKEGATPTRSLNWWKLSAVAYVTVCGGPFGLEQAVNSAGALPTLIMTVVLALFWAMPQALVTAELSSLFDINGGYIVVSTCNCSV